MQVWLCKFLSLFYSKHYILLIMTIKNLFRDRISRKSISMQAVTTIFCQPISFWNEEEPEIALHGIVSCLKLLPTEQGLWEGSAISTWEANVKNINDLIHLLKWNLVSELVYPKGWVLFFGVFLSQRRNNLRSYLIIRYTRLLKSLIPRIWHTTTHSVFYSPTVNGSFVMDGIKKTWFPSFMERLQ